MTDLHRIPPPPPPPPPRADEEPPAAGTSPVRLVILAALLALLGLAGGWAPLVVVLGVVVMIFLHELGHYLAARWSGMKVTEFFIGFGPRIWSFQRGETEYGLKAIPAGAYVKIAGMNNLDEAAPEDEARTFRQGSYPRRMAVALAGSTMHFVQAVVLLFVLYALVGVPGGSLTQDRDWAVQEVFPGTAAAEAGLEPGDRILSLDGVEYETFTDFAEEIAAHPGQLRTLEVQRDQRRFETEVEIGVSPFDPGRGALGVQRRLLATTVGPLQAAGAAARDFVEQSEQTLGFLVGFLSPSGLADFAGTVADGDGTGETPAAPSGPGPSAQEPVDENRVISILGAVRLGSDLTESGMVGFLVFFVAINITVGIFNLLPVLPLDGGHVVVATYERVREALRGGSERYHVDMARLMPFVYAVFLALVMLGVTTIYLDLVDPVEL